MTQLYTLPFTSSLQERLSPQEQRKIPSPDHIRETHQGDERTSYHLSARQCDNSGWQPFKPRSLASADKKVMIDIASSRIGSMYQTSGVVTKNQSREQLPPLSSIFGTSSHQVRPAQSPYSERPGPVYSTTSPLDARHPATPVHTESYFSRPSTARQTSYNSRTDPIEKLGFQPPPRPSASSIGSSSPRYETHNPRSDTPRSQPAPSSNEWSTVSQQPRPEYFSRDTSSSFRSHLEQRPLSSNQRSEQDPRAAYRDATVPSTPTYSTTSAITVAGDPTTSKDGLGPKIWTGTQFLPRFVRQSEVPGEGMCYFYDDGTHCKTVIDGEVVNAHWGVTKAGKPRKRLAIACITCREKKIKCDPDYPRCVQCEKFGRVCKFKNAPRGGQGSPDTPPADDDPLARSPSRLDGESFKYEKREGSHSVSPRQTLRDTTPESETHHSKRQRTGYAEFTPVASEASPQPSILEPVSPFTPWIEPVVSSSVEYNVSRDWQTNPFVSQPTLVTDLVSAFFRNVPEIAYCIFPETKFTAWLLSTKEKSLDDLMLVYTILSIGTVFSLKPEHKSLGAKYAAIARHACYNRNFTIQLVQSRLLLGLYYFAMNNANDSWDLSGAALRAASGLRLNIELEKSDEALLEKYPFDLNTVGYAECRRRTFFSCYVLDRFNGFSSGHLSFIHAEDVFLRLPCDDASFEQQIEVSNPYFEASTPSIKNSTFTIGSMAYLLNIATIWGDVMKAVYRGSSRPTTLTSNASFISFYENITYRLSQWKDSLPAHYQFSPDSVRRAAQNGNLSIYMTMYAVYHTTGMKLNRYLQKSAFTQLQLEHHTNTAKQHASEMLGMVNTLFEFRPTPNPTPSSTGELATKFTSPFVGYAILSAVDILSARVAQKEVPGLLAKFNAPLAMLGELALFWQSARNQQALVLQRVKEVGRGEEDTEGFVKMGEAIERTFVRDYDCFYA